MIWMFSGLFASLIGLKKAQQWPSKDHSFIAVGDSHTAAQNGWVEAMAKKAGLGAKAKIAKNGAQTDWMLREVRSYYAKNTAPNYMFIWAGANDAYNKVKPETTIANMNQIIDIATKAGTKVFVISGYDPKLVSYNFLLSAMYRGATEQSLGEGRDRWISLLNSYPSRLKSVSKFVGKHPTINRKQSTDGLHLSPAAYKELGEWISKQIFG